MYTVKTTLGRDYCTLLVQLFKILNFTHKILLKWHVLIGLQNFNVKHLLSGGPNGGITNVVTLLSGLSTMTKTIKMPLCLALLTACFTRSGPSLMTRPSDTIINNWACSVLLDDREQLVVNTVVAKSTSWPTRVFFCSNENCCNNLKGKKLG